MYWANMVLYLPHLYSPMNIKCWHCWKQDTGLMFCVDPVHLIVLMLHVGATR